VPTSLRPTGVIWIRAGRCHATHQCVEVARVDDMIAVRDSKNPVVVLRFTKSEIEAFLDGVKQGEFDHLVIGDGPS
jgi:Domain of unknown function (DUF397)